LLFVLIGFFLALIIFFALIFASLIAFGIFADNLLNRFGKGSLVVELADELIL
jgi:hypothetical protein